MRKRRKKSTRKKTNWPFLPDGSQRSRSRLSFRPAPCTSFTGPFRGGKTHVRASPQASARRSPGRTRGHAGSTALPTYTPEHAVEQRAMGRRGDLGIWGCDLRRPSSSHSSRADVRALKLARPRS